MNNLISYLKNVRAELTHVVWPSNKSALVHTGLIILMSAFAALFLGALDYLFTNLVGALVIN